MIVELKSLGEDCRPGWIWECWLVNSYKQTFLTSLKSSFLPLFISWPCRITPPLLSSDLSPPGSYILSHSKEAGISMWSQESLRLTAARGADKSFSSQFFTLHWLLFQVQGKTQAPPTTWLGSCSPIQPLSVLSLPLISSHPHLLHFHSHTQLGPSTVPLHFLVPLPGMVFYPILTELASCKSFLKTDLLRKPFLTSLKLSFLPLFISLPCPIFLHYVCHHLIILIYLFDNVSIISHLAELWVPKGQIFMSVLSQVSFGT